MSTHISEINNGYSVTTHPGGYYYHYTTEPGVTIDSRVVPHSIRCELRGHVHKELTV